MHSIAQYELIDELGRGGFATVYRARDTQMEREVALKVITGTFTNEAAFVRRFRQEARIAANLRHPNIVPVYEFGEVDSALYIAMALIGEGRTLRDLLDAQAPLSLAEALPLLAPLAAALDYLHQQDSPLVHRDIKPSNVLLEATDGRRWVVLTDFGLVRSLQASVELTQTGSILGTPTYLAPEQTSAAKWGAITPRSDIYALGVLAYEMLTGRAPFVGETPTVLHAQAYEPPPPPQELQPDLGAELSAVLLQALRKPPAERYSSAGALVTALQAVADTWNEAAQQEATLEQLEAQAQELLESGAWSEALSCCVEIIKLDADRPAAQEMLTRAKQGWDQERAQALERRRLAERYQVGLDLLAETKWQQALEAFKEVSKGNPDFRDVQEKQAHAQDELQRAQWYDEAIAHGEAERWAAACRAWLQVLHDRLDYRHGDAVQRFFIAVHELLSLYHADRERLGLRARLAESIQKTDWAGVIETGKALLALAPDLHDVHVWVEMAQLADKFEKEGETGSPTFPPETMRQILSHSGWSFQKHLNAGGVNQSPVILHAADDAPDALICERDDKEMVRIPAGPFLYGDDKEERELPEFWLDKTPVTNADYARFVAATEHTPPKHWKGERPPEEIAAHPVTYVSWHDALAYAEWAGKRLPTEEEWEKAARGTDGRTYPWGEEKPTPNLCNFGKRESRTTPVSKYTPQGDSPYGCVDMAGNVWEWTASDYDDKRKVLRGGSWLDSPNNVRGANRYGLAPDDTWYGNGFRCARSPK